MRHFILAQILPPEAPVLGLEASGGSILTKVKAASAPLCRPSGWTCLWRRIGNLSVLNRKGSVA
ncbi:MAG: hypothetical protein RL128_1752 [Pseudomonadota bacterium]|jgi:hypothetical protein